MSRTVGLRGWRVDGVETPRGSALEFRVLGVDASVDDVSVDATAAFVVVVKKAVHLFV